MVVKILKRVSNLLMGVSAKEVETETEAEYLVLNKRVVKAVLTQEESKILDSLVIKIRGFEGVKRYKVSERN